MAVLLNKIKELAVRCIDIVITRPVEWKIGSWLIQRTTRRNYSHCAMVWRSESLGINLAYQATLGGVQFWSGAKFNKINHTVKLYRVVVSDDQHKDIIRESVELSGSHYGYLSVLGLGLAEWAEQLIKRLSGRKVSITAPWGDGKKSSFCSELIGYVVLQKIFGSHINDGNLDNLKTDDLDDLLEKLCLIYPDQIKLLKI